MTTGTEAPQPPIPARVFRAANIVLAMIFLFAATVQYNDPDPVQWTLIYMLPAVACVMAARGRVRALFPGLVGAAALVWAFILLPSVLSTPVPEGMFDSLQMMSPEVEEARELGGLAIVIAWMAVLTIRSMRKRSQH